MSLPKKGFKALAAMSLALCMGMGLSACSSSASSSPQADANGEITVINWTNGGTSLDPSENYQGWMVTRSGITETLYKINSDFSISPLLAESAELINDTTWEITIRDGVTFQNGKACDAAAVKASLERTVANNARAAAALCIESMEAEGQKLTVHTTTKVATLINELTEPVTSIVDVNSGEDFTTKPIGTGPFMVESVTGDGDMTLVRYEGYWQGVPALAVEHTRFIKDSDATANALQSGEVDGAMNIAQTKVSLFSNSSSYTISQSNQARAHMLYFNMESEIMSDAAVREALTYCIDRDSYVNSIYAGAAVTISGCFPEETGLSNGINVASFNLDKAKSILSAAGWTDSDGDGYLDKDGTKLSLTFATYQSTAELPMICEDLSSKLKTIGIEVTIDVADKIATRLGEGNWDVATMSYNTLPTGDPTQYLKAVMSSSGNSNYGKYSNAEVDALIEQLTSESDSAKRAELAQQIQEIALGDYAYVYIVDVLSTDVCSSKVSNLAMDGPYYYVTYQTSVSE